MTNQTGRITRRQFIRRAGIGAAAASAATMGLSGTARAQAPSGAVEVFPSGSAEMDYRVPYYPYLILFAEYRKYNPNGTEDGLAQWFSGWVSEWDAYLASEWFANCTDEFGAYDPAKCEPYPFSGNYPERQYPAYPPFPEKLIQCTADTAEVWAAVNGTEFDIGGQKFYFREDPVDPSSAPLAVPSGTSYAGGGTILLKASDRSGMPRYFNLGVSAKGYYTESFSAPGKPGFQVWIAGNGGAVFIMKDVDVRGESFPGIPLPPLTEGQKPQLIDQSGRMSGMTTVYGGGAEYPVVGLVGALSSMLPDFDGNQPIKGKNIMISGIRFDSFAGHAVYISSSRDYAVIDGCVFSNGQHLMQPTAGLLVRPIEFENFTRAVVGTPWPGFSLPVYLNGSLRVSGCKFFNDDIAAGGYDSSIDFMDSGEFVSEIVISGNEVHQRFENHPDPAGAIGVGGGPLRDDGKLYIGTDSTFADRKNVINSSKGISTGSHAFGNPREQYIWYNEISETRFSAIEIGYIHPENASRHEVIYANKIINHRGVDILPFDGATEYPSAIWLNGANCGVVGNTISGTGASAFIIEGENNHYSGNDSGSFIARDMQLYIGEYSGGNTFSQNTFGPLASQPRAESARIRILGSGNIMENDRYVGDARPWEQGHGVWLMGTSSFGNIVKCPDVQFPLKAPLDHYWRDLSPRQNTLCCNDPASELYRLGRRCP